MSAHFGKRWIILAALIGAIIVGGFISLAVQHDEMWRDRCHRAGGSVKTRSTGFITTIINGYPYLQPTSEDYCVVDGREVKV